MTYTLTAPCQYLEEIKKSRFLSRAFPVANTEQAQQLLATNGDPGATHNCWAWKLGQNYRFNDDGEPAGTAGRPILAAIEHQQFDGVLVLVTRWFGGQKLGTGGLARAYGGGAAKCLQLGDRVLLIPRQRFVCHCQYPDLALLKARLVDAQVELLAEHFNAQGANLELGVPQSQIGPVKALLRDLTRGSSELLSLDDPQPVDNP